MTHIKPSTARTNKHGGLYLIAICVLKGSLFASLDECLELISTLTCENTDH